MVLNAEELLYLTKLCLKESKQLDNSDNIDSSEEIDELFGNKEDKKYTMGTVKNVSIDDLLLSWGFTKYNEWRIAIDKNALLYVYDTEDGTCFIVRINDLPEKMQMSVVRDRKLNKDEIFELSKYGEEYKCTLKEFMNTIYKVAGLLDD